MTLWGSGHTCRHGALWSLIALGVLAASGCSGGETAATTTTFATTVSDTDAPTTSAPATSTTTTTQPPTTAPTTPPTTAPRTKADVKAEVIRVANRYYEVQQRCAATPKKCDPRHELYEYTALRSPLGLAAVNIRRNLINDNSYGRDPESIVRVLEQVEVSTDLTTATITACEVDPLVVVTEIDGAEQVLNDDVGRERHTFEMFPLVDGSWVIGDSAIDDDLTAKDVSSCEQDYQNGDGTPLLKQPTRRTNGNEPTPPPTTNPDDAAQAETEALRIIKKLNADIDRCYEQPTNCQLDQAPNTYALSDNAVFLYLSRTEQLVEKNRVVEDVSLVQRTIDSVTVNKALTVISIGECYDDQSIVLENNNGEFTPIERDPITALVQHDFINLPDRGWTLMSSSAYPSSDLAEVPACLT